MSRIQVAVYKSDSTGYEPRRQQVYNYNENGLLTQDYSRLYGKYGSETLDSYCYTGTRLDSMTTQVSAKNFNSTSIFSHDAQGRIIKEVSKGVYATFQRDYNYDDQGRISQILMKHKSGNLITTTFKYKGEQLDRVEQREGMTPAKEKLEITFYLNLKPFAFFKEDTMELEVYDLPRGNFMGKVASKDINKEIELLRNSRTQEAEFLKLFNKLVPQSDLMLQSFDAVENTTGDWIKRYEYMNQYGIPVKSYLFRKLYYSMGARWAAQTMMIFMYVGLIRAS